ncbi:MAG: hypothetical protein QE277_00595 [Flectobacillus sp.]|nr:hypothetical protein [Flectobacillus sp.]
MFKQFIDKIEGADTYMVTSFVIFFSFFVLVSAYLFLIDKKHIEQMSKLPLEA